MSNTRYNERSITEIYAIAPSRHADAHESVIYPFTEQLCQCAGTNFPAQRNSLDTAEDTVVATLDSQKITKEAVVTYGVLDTLEFVTMFPQNARFH